MEDDTPIPWPQKGDRLFISGNDWWNNACLNYGNDSWQLYTAGYKLAGDIVAEAVQANRIDQEVLVFPKKG